jgi:hypothetical protein
MGVTLSAIWSQVEKLIVDGISVIPVRDKHDPESGRAAKTPFGSWKKYQEKSLTKDELWHLMDYYNTEAVGTVCGKVSGNLEVIDIDVKFKLGIDAILFQDIKTLYPELFDKLRIHKSPSGGYHILYRISDNVVPGNLKLAGRMATEEELLKDPKNKTYNFFETRGEGGYVLAPPSMGYSVHQENPIPVLTWEERCSLITLCETYNEIIKVVPTYKSTKTESEYYTENPFDDFNHRCNPIEFFKKYGWEFFKQNNRFIWFTRPGKTTGVSASWNLEKNIFYIFTASTELEAAKGYYPSTILSELEFQGDKRKTYQHLVSNGYGKVKPSIEKSMAKKRASSGDGLPKNFSEQARTEYEYEVNRLKQDHPFGIFIKYDQETEKINVSYEALLCVAKELGLFLYDDHVVFLNKHIIERINDRKFQDILKAYIREEDPDEYEKLCNVFEKFLKENTTYITKRLSILPEEALCQDTREECFKFYNNGFLLITRDTIEFNEYDRFDKLVWKDKIQPRDYKIGAGGRFVEYLNLALVNPEAVRPVFGFLSHEFKDETTGYIIVLTEACNDPQKGGGSGKNVFCNLLKLTTTYSSSPGSQGKFDEKFFQSWNFEKVFGINDLPKNFDFANLKEAASGTIKVKKLWANEENVDVEKAPKLITQTNFSYVNSDGGLKRRIIPVEFTDFFTLAGGLDMYFGVHFPKGWSEDDYIGFDNYIAESIQMWMRNGCKLRAVELTESGWTKQWHFGYKSAATFVSEHIESWLTAGILGNSEFDVLLKAFAEENNLPKHLMPSKQGINSAIKAYCERHGYEYQADVPKRFNGDRKCRIFFKVGDTPPDVDADEDDETPF